MNVQDATEVMQGFHSEKGMEMMRRLPKSKTIPENAKEVSQVRFSMKHVVHTVYILYM